MIVLLIFCKANIIKKMPVIVLSHKHSSFFTGYIQIEKLHAMNLFNNYNEWTQNELEFN